MTAPCPKVLLSFLAIISTWSAAGQGAGGEVTLQGWKEVCFSSWGGHIFRPILVEQFRNESLSLRNANHLDCSNIFGALMILKHCLYAVCKATIAWTVKDNFKQRGEAINIWRQNGKKYLFKHSRHYFYLHHTEHWPVLYNLSTP